MLIAKESYFISIIIPVYNVEKFLHNCLDSVLKQTYRNLEIILIDDGSTDNSGKICDNYAKIDNRIIVIHKENGGVSSARNVALKIAKGDYIVWIDSDDFISKNMITYLCEKILEFNADIYFFNYNIIKKDKIEKIKLLNLPNGIISKKEVFKYLSEEYKMPNFLWNKFARRKLYKNIVFDENIQMLEDYDIMPYLLNEATKIVYINECLYNYRQVESSITHNVDKNIIKKQIKIIKIRENYILNKFPELESSVNAGKAYVSLNLLPICFENGFFILFQYLKKILIKNLPDFLLNKRIKLKYKIKVLLLLFNHKYYFAVKRIIKIFLK